MEKNKDTTEIDSNKSKDDEKTAEQIESDRNDIGLERTYRQKEIKQKISIFLSRNFKWLLLTWLLLIFLVGIFFFIWPEYKIIRSLNKVTREQKENEYTKNKEYLYEIENLISVYRKIDKVDIEKIDLLLPLNNIQEELFPKLKEIVTINGLILESLSIKGEGNDSSRGIITLPDSENNDLTDKASLPEKVGKIKIHLSIVGVDYFSLVNVLDSIEKNLRLLDVAYINFSPENNLLVLELYAYYLKE